MKYLSILFTILFFLSCSNSTRQPSDRVNRPFSTQMVVWAIGSGNNKEEAELSARTFLAEQQNGVRFLITRGTFATKVRPAVLRGSVPVSFQTLKDGKVVCLMKMENNVATRAKPFIRAVQLSVPLQSLTENREDFYRQIIADLFKDIIRKRKRVYGAIFISGLTGLNNAKNLPDRVHLELKIMILLRK